MFLRGLVGKEIKKLAGPIFYFFLFIIIIIIIWLCFMIFVSDMEIVENKTKKLAIIVRTACSHCKSTLT